VSDDPTKKTKRRKLRIATETVRERAKRVTESQQSTKPSVRRRITSKFHFIRVALRFLTKPFRFLGHYIIPPYFRNSWRELRLVTWPTRKQTRQLTLAVIMFSVVLGSFVALLDLGFGKLFKEVIIK
jgi:preprotein translocase subunit SecE